MLKKRQMRLYFTSERCTTPALKISKLSGEYRLCSKECTPVHRALTGEKESSTVSFWPFSKHETCPLDDDDAILLVDAETESVPYTDEDGNPLYYCLEGEHTFSIEADDDWGSGNRKRR